MNGKIVEDEKSPTGYKFLCDRCNHSLFRIDPTEDGDCSCRCVGCDKEFDVCWGACNLGGK